MIDKILTIILRLFEALDQYTARQNAAKKRKAVRDPASYLNNLDGMPDSEHKKDE